MIQIEQKYEIKGKPNEQIKNKFEFIYKNWIWGGNNQDLESTGGGSGPGILII
jgi:hypothetical protein